MADLIEPKLLTPDDIIENNLVADTTSDWDDSTAYTVTAGAEATQVRVAYESDMTTPVIPVKLYELIADSLAGHYPPDYPAEWQDAYATNRWRWMNKYLYMPAVATGAEASDPGKIVLKLNTGKMDRCGLFGLSATDITFELFDGDGVLLDTDTYSLKESDNIISWSSFFYAPRYYRKTLLHSFRLRHASSLRITIADTRDGYMPELGYALVGRRVFLGTALMGAKVSMLDYGTTVAKLLDAEIRIDAKLQDYFNGLLGRLYDVPVVLDANNDGIDYENFSVLGTVQDFGIEYTNDRKIPMTIQITGLKEQKE